MERLDKFLVGASAGSRSQVKDILKAGRVTVNGTVVKTALRKWMNTPKSAWMGNFWAENEPWC